MSAPDTLMPLVSAPWLDADGHPLSVRPLPGLRSDVIQSLECSYPGILTPAMKALLGSSCGLAGTELGSLLADARDLVIVGMQSEYCVRETSLAALEQGFTVLLPRGAHATYGNRQRSAAQIAAAVEDELAQAGARILDADDVTF